MAFLPERKNSLTLAKEFRQKLSQRTGLTDFDADSKIENLISIFVDEIVNSRNEVLGAFQSMQISTATGNQLDSIGLDLGLPRFGETAAFSLKREQNVAFYVSSGTFGDLNSGSDIVVSAGTEIYSEENENDFGKRIVYKTTSSLTLSASATIGFADVRAVASGSGSNIGSGTLLNHSVSGYTGLKVVNFFSILNGRNEESDKNYRFRLSKRYDMLASSNDSKLHLESLKVPGVLDTRIVNGYYGIGTAAVIVLGPENLSNTNTLAAVQTKLNQLQGPGCSYTAAPATAVYLDLELEVKSSTPMSAGERRQFEMNIKTGIRNFLRSLGIGPSFSIRDLSAEVINYAGNAKFVSTKQNNVFNVIYLRKGLSSASPTEREIFKSNALTLEQDEYADIGTVTVRYL
jgi:uncharacterized phage protein gp47/JayE